MTTGSFEATKHSYRQSRDGIVVSFLINPADPHDEIAKAALGTRFMVAFSEVGVDEPAPKPVPSKPAEKPAKIRRAFAEMSPTAQAGMRANDTDFQRFLRSYYPYLSFNSEVESYAQAIRDACGVISRSEFTTDDGAAARWRDLERQFQAWLTDERYADQRT